MSSEDPFDEAYEEAVEQTEDRAEYTDRIVERFIGYKNGIKDGIPDITQIGVYNKVVITSEYKSKNSKEDCSNTSGGRHEKSTKTRRGFLSNLGKKGGLAGLVTAGATGAGVAAYLDGRMFDVRLAEDDSIGEVLDSGLSSNNPEVERVSGELVESFGGGNYTLVMEDAYLGPNAVGLEKEGELQEVYDVDQQAYNELRQEVRKFT
ncbi:MAG: hypothetical protein ABEK16_01540 [Candidatus Nanohalobium sp.]